MIILLDLEATGVASDITVEILLNEISLYKSSLIETPITITHNFNDIDYRVDQKIQIKFDGKTHHHTIVDSDGNITTDVALLVKKFEIEHINVTDVFCSGKKCYQHDFNGTSLSICDEFYGYIGCNGVVTFDFYCPIYLWIGEHFV
jgi:uncharacterized 2Fe-2S/4Fe-4S cluster protein (DUF4445 family)